MSKLDTILHLYFIASIQFLQHFSYKTLHLQTFFNRKYGEQSDMEKYKYKSYDKKKKLRLPVAITTN